MRFLLAVMAAGLVAAGAADVSAQDGPKEGKPPFKLGVVNLRTCFDKDKYERVKEVDVELQKLADEYAKKIQDIERKIITLKEQADALPRDSALRAQKILELRRAESDHKFEKEYGKQRYLNFYSDKKIEIYNEIRKAVDAIAKEQRFDLVLRVEAPQLDDQDQAPDTLSQQLLSRVVLFYNESVDITDMVVVRLNEEYKKKKNGK